MTITVNWITGRIGIERTDMTLIQASPEVRELDVNAFRLTLKGLEDDPEGMPWPRTHNHAPPVTLSGFTYARTFEIIPPYFVEFETGNYRVQFSGANHNILDVAVQDVTQPNLSGQNAAGLIEAPVTFDENDRTLLDELHRLHGLKNGAPLTVTRTAQTAGDISLTMTQMGSGASTQTVVSRD